MRRDRLLSGGPCSSWMPPLACLVHSVEPGKLSRAKTLAGAGHSALRAVLVSELGDRKVHPELCQLLHVLETEGRQANARAICRLQEQSTLLGRGWRHDQERSP